jgi:hypothetical protein
MSESTTKTIDLDMKLRAGVLILGSLLWDNADRERWRGQRLEMASSQQVWLPIRYGRLSGTRGDTHTMVLSNLCYAHRELGEAFVVPYMRPIQTAEDLIAEACELVEAERLAKWTWGAVGVLTSPTSKVPCEILAGWKDFAAEKLRNCALFTHHTKSERPILSKSGLLQLRWPRSVDTSKPVDLDILLATPTAPTLAGGRYPRSREIGETYARQNRPEYFVKNVRHRIRTANDKDIWKSSLRLKPEWAKQYADVAVALGLGHV